MTVWISWIDRVASRGPVGSSSHTGSLSVIFCDNPSLYITHPRCKIRKTNAAGCLAPIRAGCTWCCTLAGLYLLSVNIMPLRPREPIRLTEKGTFYARTCAQWTSLGGETVSRCFVDGVLNRSQAATCIKTPRRDTETGHQTSKASQLATVLAHLDKPGQNNGPIPTGLP